MNAGMNMDRGIYGKASSACWSKKESNRKVRREADNAPRPQMELTAEEVEELMRHDSYRRVKGAIRQVGYGST